MYNDTFAKTFDLEFMYKAKTLAAAIQASPAHVRKNAPLVADLFTNTPVLRHA
jgi:hypothetical protein